MTDNDTPGSIPNDMSREEFQALLYRDFARRKSSVEPWWKRLLNPTFRRWAYGVSGAAVSVYAVATEQPALAAMLAPLILALFYVDTNGDPR